VGCKEQPPSLRYRIESPLPLDKSEHGKLNVALIGSISKSSSIPGVTAEKPTVEITRIIGSIISTHVNHKFLDTNARVIFQDVINFARKISGNFIISISRFFHTQCCTTENEVRMAPPGS
jgi:hypothetical protein